MFSCLLNEADFQNPFSQSNEFGLLVRFVENLEFQNGGGLKFSYTFIEGFVLI